VSEERRPVRVVFVCWGNICRSPMAERVARHAAREAGLRDVEFTSAATSREELGEPIDPRAVAVLRRAGYDADGHVAHQIQRAEVEGADVVIAMEDIHVRKLRAIAPQARNIRLLTDYDPAATPGSGVPDPWYGSADGFRDTLRAVESAIPGVLDHVRALPEGRRRSA
jgi:protein-tyrosine phosphatase